MWWEYSNDSSNSLIHFLAFAIGDDVAIKHIPTIVISILNGRGATPKNIIVAPVKANKSPTINNTIDKRFWFISIKFRIVG